MWTQEAQRDHRPACGARQVQEFLDPDPVKTKISDPDPAHARLDVGPGRT